MLLLAIDTSTHTASVALVQDEEIVAELTWHSGQNHTLELLPNLDYLVKQARMDLRSANGVIVARGPGSFNGLRVGVSTAKGLAFSLGVPLVGISTMEVEAYPHAAIGLPICPIFDAGREEIATALFQKQDAEWHQLVAEHITTVDVLCSQIAGKTLFCGEFISVIHSRLKVLLGDRAVIVGSASRLRRAGFLAELGIKRMKADDYDSVATLKPLYLRQPPITEPRHR